MPNMFTPNTTVVPNVEDTDKLDEMIKLLQDNINSSMRMKQYGQSQEDRSKKLLTEKASVDALKELYYNKPGYEQLKNYFDDPNITSGVMGGLINQVQEIEKNNLIEQKAQGLMEQKTTSYKYLDERYKSDPEAHKLIQDNKNIFNPPEKALADIQSLENRRAAKEAALLGKADKEGKNQELLVSQAGAINSIKKLRDTGLMFDNYNVKIHGTDRHPFAQIVKGKDQYRKTESGYMWKNPKTNTWVDAKLDDGNWVIRKGKNHDIPGGVIKSLDGAFEFFQSGGVKAKGKDTEEFTGWY